MESPAGGSVPSFDANGLNAPYKTSFKKYLIQATMQL